MSSRLSTKRDEQTLVLSHHVQVGNNLPLLNHMPKIGGAGDAELDPPGTSPLRAHRWCAC